MSNLVKDWIIDIQENGDDGTGHCDYAEVTCDYCEAGIAENHNHESEGDWVCTITGEVMDDFGNIIDEDDNNE